MRFAPYRRKLRGAMICGTHDAGQTWYRPDFSQHNFSECFSKAPPELKLPQKRNGADDGRAVAYRHIFLRFFSKSISSTNFKCHQSAPNREPGRHLPAPISSKFSKAPLQPRTPLRAPYENRGATSPHKFLRISPKRLLNSKRSTKEKRAEDNRGRHFRLPRKTWVRIRSK